VSEREAAVTRPRCPKCGFPEAAQLMHSEYVYRWQCRNHDCLEQFTTPRERSVSDLVADEKWRRAMKAEEVAQMANKDVTCGKCGEEQRSPRSKGQHERFCDGKRGGSAFSRPCSKAQPAAKAAPAARSTMEMILVIDAVPEHLKGSALAPAVEHLLERRKSLEAELAETNQAIATVSKLTPRDGE
jgi:hypothetical protein